MMAPARAPSATPTLLLNSFSTLTIAGTAYMEGNVTVNAGGTVAVNAGANIQVSSGDVLAVNGTLNMAGTATSPITMTSAAPIPGRGDWRGIEFTSSSSGGSLSHVLIADAGGTNSDIVNCCTNAAVTIQGANPIITNSSFTNNKGWAVYYATPPTNFGADSGLSAVSDDENAVGIASGTLGTNASWGTASLGIPLEISGNLVVDIGATLDSGQRAARCRWPPAPCSPSPARQTCWAPPPARSS